MKVKDLSEGVVCLWKFVKKDTCTFAEGGEENLSVKRKNRRKGRELKNRGRLQ